MNWTYITGFFDADGSITLVTPNKGKKKTLQLSFHNNEINILNSIREFIENETTYKGSISVKKAKKIAHNDSYDLKYSYRAALTIASKLKPLHHKKVHRIAIYKQIQAVTPRNGKYTEKNRAKRSILEEKFWKH